MLQPRPVDLNTVANGLHSLLDKVIGKNIEVKFLTTPLDPVKADPTQLEQVLMNLCINARDAMPKGGRLVIETEMVELDEPYCRFYPNVTPGRYAVLSVADTGEGMDPETRERIFEPFFTTKERGKGTGMGLATVYGIVKQHGGFIHVYSEPSHGSLFRVYVPAMDGAAPHGAMVKSTVPSRSEMRGTETILLAEDHESIREMARQTLVSLGYRVLSAADGEEALRLSEHERPALAILDVIMPKMGGRRPPASWRSDIRECVWSSPADIRRSRRLCRKVRPGDISRSRTARRRWLGSCAKFSMRSNGIAPGICVTPWIATFFLSGRSGWRGAKLASETRKHVRART